MSGWLWSGAWNFGRGWATHSGGELACTSGRSRRTVLFEGPMRDLARHLKNLSIAAV